MGRFRFFFFFQAEDGIRDGHVTGVQTCALPILFARLYKLLRANEAAIAIADDEEFFRKVAGAVVKIAPPTGQVSPEAEQAVKQFVSEGRSAGEGLDVFELAGATRSEVS